MIAEKEKPLISIIVPIYNAEAYLKETVKSILDQSLKDIEVLLVNDGSNDTSLDIIKELQQTDSRIVVIDKKNGGVSSARNAGVQKSSGDYIFHVDSDDLLLENALLKMYNKAKEDSLDIVVANYKMSYTNSSKIIKHNFHNQDYNHLVSLFLRGEYHNALWNKLISRKLYAENSFVEGVDYMEDKLIFVKMLQKNPKIGFTDYVVYDYKQRENSYSNNVSNKSLESIKFVVNELEKVVEDNFKRDIDYLKVRCKIMYLLNSNTKGLTSSVFKEVNSKIFKMKKVPLKYKVLLLFENIGISFFTDLYKKIKK